MDNHVKTLLLSDSHYLRTKAETFKPSSVAERLLRISGRLEAISIVEHPGFETPPDYKIELCMNMLNFCLMSNPLVENLQLSEIKERLQGFFTKEQVEEACERQRLFYTS